MAGRGDNAPNVRSVCERVGRAKLFGLAGATEHEDVFQQANDE